VGNYWNVVGCRCVLKLLFIVSTHAGMHISCIKVDHLLALGKTFSAKVINVWNALPGDAVDFSSLPRFRGSILKIDLCSELKRF